MRKNNLLLMTFMFALVGALVFGAGPLRSQTSEPIQPEPAPGTQPEPLPGTSGQEPGGAGGATEPGAAGMADPATVRAAQEALQKKGFDPGEVNGIMGEQTRQAIQSFQAANGLKVTGELDAQTVQSLEIEGSPSGPGREAPPMRSPMGPPSEGGNGGGATSGESGTGSGAGEAGSGAESGGGGSGGSGGGGGDGQ